MPKFFKWKVKAAREPQKLACTTQLAALLRCFNTTHDYRGNEACLAASEDLMMCMRTTPKRIKPRASSINHHLGKIGR